MDDLLSTTRSYSPWIWPMANWRASSKLDAGAPQSPMPDAPPYLNFWANIGGFNAAFRSFAMACFCIFVIHGGEDGFGYPAFGSAKEYSWDWMWPLLVRNLLATWIIAGSWDFFLYFSPLSKKIEHKKMNPIMPGLGQFKHDAFWTTQASVCGTAVEWWICHLYANGDYPRLLSDHPIFNFIAAITITHWRIPQFYLIHRGMHPWKNKWGPDVGKFLYKHVHSLHHKSPNPTAFSGTSMHPVEATLYYMASFCILPFNVHVALPLGCIIDCAVGAWIGHDGYQNPGGGDPFHQVHHANFDCNYGAQHVPLDWLFGTAAKNKEDMRKIWRGHKNFGEKGNVADGYSVHASADGGKKKKK